MRKIIFIIHYSLFIVFAANAANAAPQVMSNYGKIQNVQNYSNNPFYNMNGPYNQGVPIVVNAKGTEVKTNECQIIVGGLVAAECSRMNNCAGKMASDIRPGVMVALSQMNGHNYAGSCGGYIDTAFNDYVKNRGGGNFGANAFPGQFPAAAARNEIVYADASPAAAPKWIQDYIAKSVELSGLKAENAEDTTLHATKMPKTINDVSFADRVANMKAGYAPYKDASAYVPIKIETDENYAGRMSDIAKTKAKAAEDVAKAQIAQIAAEDALEQKMNPCGWCEKNDQACRANIEKTKISRNKDNILDYCNRGDMTAAAPQFKELKCMAASQEPECNGQTGCYVLVNDADNPASLTADNCAELKRQKQKQEQDRNRATAEKQQKIAQCRIILEQLNKAKLDAACVDASDPANIKYLAKATIQRWILYEDGLTDDKLIACLNKDDANFGTSDDAKGIDLAAEREEVCPSYIGITSASSTTPSSTTPPPPTTNESYAFCVTYTSDNCINQIIASQPTITFTENDVESGSGRKCISFTGMDRAAALSLFSTVREDNHDDNGGGNCDGNPWHNMDLELYVQQASGSWTRIAKKVLDD
ncbi:MAG: hypothetical protein LBO08_00860 [Rickettsiales bacterium]|jgi:hypothetical protein|nr:hypothetical protein [Rickettsiales bacterium]